MGRGLHAIAWSCFLVASLFAQVQSGRIEGTVQDPSSAVIPGAKLSIGNNRTQVKVDVESDAQGYYVFAILQPGFYTLTAEAPGFRRATIANIELNVGVTLRQDVKLEVGAVAESVMVEASSVRVQTSEATIQRAVTLRDIDVLPQLGRGPMGLATYTPGIQIRPDDTSFSRVNGMRQGSNNNTLDGIDVNDSVLPRLGLTLNSTNLDSVEEFRIITNGAKAEYGRNAGGQVELITRSGTNQFHGNLFEYHRNTVLNANDFFNNTSSQDRPKLIQNTFGGSVGGPVMIPKVFNGQDRLFFFFNFQGGRTASERVRLRQVLTPEAKRGIFRWTPPGTAEIRAFDIVANDPRKIGIDKTVTGNLALLPDPNTTCSAANCDGLNVAGFRFNSPTPSENEQWTARGDFNLRPTHRIWYRQSRLRTLSWDALNNADPTFPGQPSGTQGGIRWGFAAGSSWILKPWLVNEFIAGHQQASVDFFRVRSLTGGIPLIDANLFTNPIPTGTGSRRNSPVNQITDNLSLIKGKHGFKGGLRYSLTTQFQSSDAGIWPTINVARASGNTPPTTIGPSGAIIAGADRQRFENLYNDLLGRVSSITQTFYSDLAAFQPAGTPRNRNFKFNDYGFYFQDDWRIKPNLTLNLGLRWEFFGVPLEEDKLQGVFVQNTGLIHAANQIADLTVRRGADWYRNDWNNFAPRVGFAWDPFKNGKTSIRASWGIYYDRVLGATANDVDSSTPGFQAQSQVFPNQTGTTDIRAGDRPTLPSAPGAPVLTLPATRSQTTLALFDPFFLAPYVLQMNLTVQREIFPNTVLEAGYVGNRGVKLLADLNWNQPRVYGTFLTDFNQIREFRRSGAAVPASNVFVRMFGSTAAAITAIGGTVFDQGNVGTAANTVDTNNYTRYANAGLSQFFLRNYPQFQNVVLGTNSGRSAYDSLQVSFRRQAGSLKFAANYTWSKTLDNISVDGSGFTSPIDNFNFKLNRGRADSDRPHSITWATSYRLPIGRGRLIGGNLPGWADRLLGGWEIGSLGILTSGPVMTLSSGLATGPTTNNTWGNFSGDRTTGSVRKASNGVFFFPDAVIAQLRDPRSVPAPGEIGTAGRNTFRGPRVFTTDLSLLKRFRLHGERTFITFRFEAYNLLNNANFSTPGVNLQTPQSLGQITSTITNPRFMQLALRFDF